MIFLQYAFSDDEEVLETSPLYGRWHAVGIPGAIPCVGSVVVVAGTVP